MTAFLYQRLSVMGLIPRETLVRALGRSFVRRTSLCEALVALDVSHARSIAAAVAGLGPVADEGWRPDRHLLMDLPPGISEQYLAFPYRERAGKIELATVCAVDDAVRLEFEVHLGRPVVLFRARLQALLAAANAPIDLDSLAQFLSQPPPPADGVALPLLKKHQKKAEQRRRIPTSPGLGRKGSDSIEQPEDRSENQTGRATPGGRGRVPKLKAPPPNLVTRAQRASNSVDVDSKNSRRVASCFDVYELAAVLGEVLPAPALIFEHAQGRLYLRIASGPGTYQDEVVSLSRDHAFSWAVRDGKYVGGFFDCPEHARFWASFPMNSIVFVCRIGPLNQGLVVICSGDFEQARVSQLLDLAEQRAKSF